jgi:hypothetical protein
MRRLRIEYDRLVELTREARDFLDSRYDKARRVEEIIEMITEVKKTNSKALTIRTFEERAGKELAELDNKLRTQEERLASLEETPFVAELNTIKGEIKKAEKRIYSRSGNLRRPIKKMKFLAKKKRLDNSPETLDLLRRCKNRVDIHQIEQMGIKSFHLLMNIIREAIKGNRISLKKEERTRVIETLNTILDERIIESELNERRANKERIQNLLSSEDGVTYQSRRSNLKKEEEELKKEMSSRTEQLESIKNSLQESLLEIEETKRRLEKNIHDLIGEEINI